jgi:hypothetical protein
MCDSLSHANRLDPEFATLLLKAEFSAYTYRYATTPDMSAVRCSGCRRRVPSSEPWLTGGPYSGLAWTIVTPVLVNPAVLREPFLAWEGPLQIDVAPSESCNLSAPKPAQQC